MNVLLIGGSNFIGWRLLKSLESEEHRVTVINRGNVDREYPSNAEHIVSDRRDEAMMRSAIGSKEFDVVYDMCGFSVDDMTPVLRVLDGRVGKYVYVSTAAVYVEPLVMPIGESYPQGPHPRWAAYGSAKLSCEEALRTVHQSSGFPYLVVRPSYVYGAGNTINRECFLFDRISKARPILIPGGGEAVIQLGEVADLCGALLLAGQGPAGCGEAYNVSGSELVTLRALVRLAQEVVGRETELVSVGPAEFGFTDRDLFPFDNSSYFTSSEKFASQFGWSQGITLREGLEAAYEEWLRFPTRIPQDYEKEESVLLALGRRH